MRLTGISMYSCISINTMLETIIYIYERAVGLVLKRYRSIYTSFRSDVRQRIFFSVDCRESFSLSLHARNYIIVLTKREKRGGGGGM